MCAARAFGVSLQVLREALDDVFACRDENEPSEDFVYIVRELVRDGVAMTADIDDRTQRALALVQSELKYLTAQMAEVIGENPTSQDGDPYPLG